ncbi:mgtA regulatory leader peptide MgtL [Kosakonia cowanii]
MDPDPTPHPRWRRPFR